MSTPSASNESENGVTMPAALAFLVSNFHSLVTIKLNAENFLLWKTQVLNALRANGFIEYVRGTIGPPPTQIRDSSNNLVTNPAFLTWTLIDNQLLSCLTATLSSSTFPLVLGLEHASDVWNSLENRFNSLSRSNLHELKRTLFNFTKTESMDKYIDDIKVCAQKLSAVGYEVDDDDMVFHAINGLPEEEFSSLKQTLRTHRDLKFHELVSILKAEEHQSRKGKNKMEDGASSVFLTTTQKLQDLNISGVSSSNQNSVSQTTGNLGSNYVLTSPILPTPTPALQSFQPQTSQPFQMFQPQPPSLPMFQPAFGQSSTYFPQSTSRFNNNNRNRPRGQGFVSFPRPACQICGIVAKTITQLVLATTETHKPLDIYLLALLVLVCHLVLQGLVCHLVLMDFRCLHPLVISLVIRIFLCVDLWFHLLFKCLRKSQCLLFLQVHLNHILSHLELVLFLDMVKDIKDSSILLGQDLQAVPFKVTFHQLWQLAIHLVHQL